MIKQKFHDLIQKKCKDSVYEYMGRLDGFDVIDFKIFISLSDEEYKFFGLNSNIRYSCKYSYTYPNGYGIIISPHYKYKNVDIIDDFSVFNLLEECILQDTNKPIITSDIKNKYKRIDKIKKIKALLS